MSVKTIVTVPSAASDALRSGRCSRTSRSSCSRLTVSSRPSTCSFGIPAERCSWTIFHSPCSRWRTHVARMSVACSCACIVSLAPAQPTLPSSQASISSHSNGKPPDSSNWASQTARSRACHHSLASDPTMSTPGCSEILPRRAAISPPRTATSQRSMTRPISGDDSTRRETTQMPSRPPARRRLVGGERERWAEPDIAQTVHRSRRLGLRSLDERRYIGYPGSVAKVLVSLDDALLRRVDRIAKSRGLSRSAYLAELAERDAARSEGPGTSRAARAALVRLDGLFEEGPAEDSTAAIRAERDAR